MVSLLKILHLPQKSFGTSQLRPSISKRPSLPFSGELVISFWTQGLRCWGYDKDISCLFQLWCLLSRCSSAHIQTVLWLWSLLPVLQVSYLGITVVVRSYWIVNWRSAWSRILLGHSCCCSHRQWVAGVLHIFYKLLTPWALMKNFSSRNSHTILPPSHQKPAFWAVFLSTVPLIPGKFSSIHLVFLWHTIPMVLMLRKKEHLSGDNSWLKVWCDAHSFFGY